MRSLELITVLPPEVWTCKFAGNSLRVGGGRKGERERDSGGPEGKGDARENLGHLGGLERKGVVGWGWEGVG